MYMGIKGRGRGMKLLESLGRDGSGYLLLRKFLLEGWILGGLKLLSIMVSFVVLSLVRGEVKRIGHAWLVLYDGKPVADTRRR